MQVPLSQTEIHQEQLGQIGLARLKKEELGLRVRTQEPLVQLRFEGQTQLPDPKSQSLKQNLLRQMPMPFGQHALDRQTQMARGQNGLHC